MADRGPNRRNSRPRPTSATRPGACCSVRRPTTVRAAHPPRRARAGRHRPARAGRRWSRPAGNSAAMPPSTCPTGASQQRAVVRLLRRLGGRHVPARSHTTTSARGRTSAASAWSGAVLALGSVDRQGAAGRRHATCRGLLHRRRPRARRARQRRRRWPDADRQRQLGPPRAWSRHRPGRTYPPTCGPMASITTSGWCASEPSDWTLRRVGRSGPTVLRRCRPARASPRAPRRASRRASVRARGCPTRGRESRPHPALV